MHVRRDEMDEPSTKSRLITQCFSHKRFLSNSLVSLRLARLEPRDLTLDPRRLLRDFRILVRDSLHPPTSMILLQPLVRDLDLPPRRPLLPRNLRRPLAQLRLHAARVDLSEKLLVLHGELLGHALGHGGEVLGLGFGGARDGAVDRLLQDADAGGEDLLVEFVQQAGFVGDAEPGRGDF